MLISQLTEGMRKLEDKNRNINEERYAKKVNYKVSMEYYPCNIMH